MGRGGFGHFHPGLICGEHPADLGSFGAAVLPSPDLGFEQVAIVDPSVKTLSAHDADLDLGHVEPTGMLGGVVELQASQDSATALAPGVLPDLIKIVDGNPRRVMSITDFDEHGLGVRTTGREPGLVSRYDALGRFAQLAAEGRFKVPVARTFSMEDWRTALALSQSGHAHGKLLILPNHAVLAG